MYMCVAFWVVWPPFMALHCSSVSNERMVKILSARIRRVRACTRRTGGTSPCRWS